MGRPLAGQWTYDVLCLVDYLAREAQFESIRVAGRGREMGLVCLLATLFDDRIEAADIDRMFSSFVQLVGYGNPASQIPGVLRVADVGQVIRAAGTNRIRMNNLRQARAPRRFHPRKNRRRSSSWISPKRSVARGIGMNNGPVKDTAAIR